MSGIGPISETPPPLNLFVGPFNPGLLFTNTVFPTANAAALAAFQVRRPITVSDARIRVGVQSGNIDLGIYSDAGARLASTGATACPAAAATVTIALTASLLLVPGVKYWAAVAADNTTVTFGIVSAAQGPSVVGRNTVGRQNTSYPLPANLAVAPSGLGQQTYGPVIVFG